jgi:hypothetical protein
MGSRAGIDPCGKQHWLFREVAGKVESKFTDADIMCSSGVSHNRALHLLGSSSELVEKSVPTVSPAIERNC